MSGTGLFAVAALLPSLAALLWLAWGDPKRRRSQRRRGGHSPAQRRLLAAVILLPGLALAFSGEWPAFLIWLGFAATAGWGAAMTLAQLRRA